MTGVRVGPAELSAWTEVGDTLRLPAAPLVSVLMLAYNHEQYLAEAIESVVAQQCDFPFELVIGEDASTDSTREIACAYQRRFPDLVRVILSTKNAGINENSRRIFALSRGEFIATCEGDDYWCDLSKLARQVALLQGDSSIGVVHTDWVRARDRLGTWQVTWGASMHQFLPRHLLQGALFSTFHNPKILRTCTRMTRRSVLEACFASSLAAKRYRFFDTVLAAFTTSRWAVGYLPEVTAVYRESPHSVLRSGIRARLDFLRSSLEFDTCARNFFSGDDRYPTAYRWEVGVGLLMWALRARDLRTVSVAVADLRSHFTVPGLMLAGWKTLKMRFPSFGYVLARLGLWRSRNIQSLPPA